MLNNSQLITRDQSLLFSPANLVDETQQQKQAKAAVQQRLQRRPDKQDYPPVCVRLSFFLLFLSTKKYNC